MPRENRPHVHIDSYTERFVDRINSVPDLSAEDEMDKIQRWREHGDIEARDEVILSTMKVAVAVAWQHRRFGVPFSDMVCLGAAGIMKALSKYDLDRNVRFASYAWNWIRAMISRAECRQWSMLSGQATSSRSLFSLLKAMGKGQSIHGPDRDAVFQYVADQLGIPFATAVEWLTLVNSRLVSLESTMIFRDDEVCLKDQLVSHYEPPADVQFEDREIRRMVRMKLAEFSRSLSAREVKILERRLLRHEPESLEVIACEVGVSRERIRQLEHILRGKLRKVLREEAEELGINTKVCLEKILMEQAA